MAESASGPSDKSVQVKLVLLGTFSLMLEQLLSGHQNVAVAPLTLTTGIIHELVTDAVDL